MDNKMAIKNTLLGGTDWASGEVWFSADINDTYDEIASIVDNGN